jgi:hypothetical protein
MAAVCLLYALKKKNILLNFQEFCSEIGNGEETGEASG